MAGRIILAIVEGPSDASTLIDPLDKLLSDPDLRDLVAEGDITLRTLYAKSHPGMSGRNMGALIARLIQTDIDRRHTYRPSDLMAVIQISDLDGALVPDAHVAQGERREYTADRIFTPKVADTIRNNHEKQANIRDMLSMGEVRLGRKDVPFHPFYMSRNLEHVIWDDPSHLDAEEKRRRERQAFVRFMRNPDVLMDLLRSSEVMHDFTSFDESWEWAWRGDNSLARGSNLALLPDVLGLR